jgi:hypothetical protein
MQAPLHISTTVRSGHKIEVTDPHLMEGESVEMIVFVSPRDKSTKASALSIIESLHGHRLFQSSQEVDRYLEEERNSWGQ